MIPLMRSALAEATISATSASRAEASRSEIHGKKARVKVAFWGQKSAILGLKSGFWGRKTTIFSDDLAKCSIFCNLSVFSPGPAFPARRSPSIYILANVMSLFSLHCPCRHKEMTIWC